MQRWGWAIGIMAGGLGMNILPVLGQPVRTVQQIPLRNLGYTRPVVLRGPNPEFGVSIPIFSRNLDTKQSFVQLELAPSPVLRPNSTVRILVNGRPERVLRVKDLLPQKAVRIPLRLPPPGERFISVNLESFLQISQDFCEDLVSGNLFLTVGENSFFQIAQTETDTSINNWFRPTYSRVVLVVPATMDASTARAALWAYSVLSYHFRESRVPITWFTGDFAALRLNKNTEAAVVLHQEEQGPDIQRQGNILRVRARAEAIRALMQMQPALVTPALKIDAANPSSPPRSRNRRSFTELGWPEVVKTGLGSQSFRLTFDLAQLGGRPRDLSLALQSRFSQFSNRDPGAMNAQVFFNGILVNSFNVGTSSQLNVTLNLPDYRLQRTNNLDIVFAVDEQDCRSPRSVTTQVLGSSYLDWIDYQPPRGTFDDVPQAFLGEGQVVLDMTNPALVAGTAQVLGMLSRLGKQPLLPQVIAASEVTNWNQLPGQPAWRLVGTPPETPFQAPIRLAKAFTVINPLNQEPLLQAQPGTSIGVLQAFLHQSRPTLWLSWWGDAAEVVSQVGAVLADPIAGWGYQLQGNVVTITPQASVNMWDLTGEVLEVRYPDEINWWLLLRRYRWVILALFLVFGGILAWRLYQRLGRPPKPPIPPA